MAEIWYRGKLLDAYKDFNVYFFKLFVIHIFQQIWSQNLKLSKLTEMWYRCTWLYSYYDFDNYFFKIFVQKSNVPQIDSKLVQGHIVIWWLQFWCVIFKFWWGKFHHKICCSPYLQKFSMEIQCNSINLEKTTWNGICP